MEVKLDQLYAAQDLTSRFSELRRAHIEAIIQKIPPVEYNALTRRLMEIQFPKKNLNQNGFLLHNIFRMLEYTWNNNAMLNNVSEMKSKAFYLRKELDGCFDDNVGRVISHPKRENTGFSGCSCAVSLEQKFMGKPFLHSFQMASVQNMNGTDFAAQMRRFKAGAVGGPKNRIAMSFRLASGEPLGNEWIVDHDAAGYQGHVTIAVSSENGLEAEEVDDRKFFIPALSDMNWELTATMYVCEGRADWSDGWMDAIAAFDLIMRYGNFDEYLDIWRVHNMLHGDHVGKKPGDAKLDISVPLKLALDTVRSFLYSGECDPNESNAVVHSAISYLQKVITDIARIVVKPSMKQFKSTAALFTTNKCDEGSLDNCSRPAIELLTAECLKLTIIPTFGSAFALCDALTVSSPGAHAVTVTHGTETLTFTWNGDNFKDCVLDEIRDVENDMISLRLSGHKVCISATAIQDYC